MLLPPERRVYAGPGGMADPPRPFVLRAGHLDGKVFEPGEEFRMEIHLFDLKRPLAEAFAQAFRELERTGLGPRRARVELLPLAAAARVDLDLANGPATSATSVRFVTPTELKGMKDGTDEVPFEILFARTRDRISSLASLYGDAPLEIDFAAMGKRAGQVRTMSCELQYQPIVRRSSRTGQTHGIGGFTGTARYEGELTEFMPYLRAAWWTGIGRHTVWGNGVIRCE